jgi:pimeloyl-ACP methyl ester carboxylesterase
MTEGKPSEKDQKGWKAKSRKIRFSVYAGGAVAALFIVLLSIEPIASLGNPAPPGRLIDVGGFDMHIYCTGEGGPTVILDAGLGQGTVYWLQIQDAVSKQTRVCSYDRAGMGWSESGPKPRTYMKVTDELHRLLASSGEEGPFVLVGHSSGAHTVRFFVQDYPNEVAGIVLEDAANERVLTQEALAPGVKAMRDASLAARLGYFRIDEGSLAALAGIEVPAELKPYLHIIYNSKTFSTSADELESMPVTAEALEPTKYQGAWNDLPAIVLTADNEMGRTLGMHEHHAQLAALSTKGEQVLVNSSHNIHIDQPDAVIQAILKVVEMANMSSETFVVDVAGERFNVRVTDSEAIRLLVENYEGKNSMHVVGKLARGDGGFNSPWPWHLEPDSVGMAEVSIELCDGRPSLIEEDLEYWIETVGSYCPWSSSIVEIPPSLRS